MIITVNPPKSVVIVQERTKTIENITINEMVDNPSLKTVIAKTLELGVITVWQGADYDAVGQWTDTDVINRIKTLYNV